MMTVQEIDSRIAELKNQLGQLKGTETEVYSRIVGYYRSLNNWNRGKREEYDYRLYYNSRYAAEAGTMDTAVQNRSQSLQSELPLNDDTPSYGEICSFLFFQRQSCPNCPPMKDAVGHLAIEGLEVDVDTAEGYAMAERYTIMAAPTVVFTDNKGNEIMRATDPAELGKLPVTV